MLAMIEITAFAEWFLTNSGSLLEGKVTVQQALFPFMFLFMAVVLFMAK